MPKNNLKAKVEGNELDLSFSELKDVPVRELAAIPKATHLDLSCNFLTSLPPAFCNLSHLTKLDLSKNQLKELPPNFGDLKNLQTLDLYSNQLKVLPESFHQLTKLKWLDLKNNPLDTLLNKAAGDCLDEKQCQLCAKQVVEFMKKIHDELEKQRETKEKQRKDREAAKQAAEELKKEKQRLAKKAAKEKRRQEHQQKLLEQQLESFQSPTSASIDENHQNGTIQDEVVKTKTTTKERRYVRTLLCFCAFTTIVAVLCFMLLERNKLLPYKNPSIQMLYDKGTLVLEESLTHAKIFGNYTRQIADTVVKFTAEKVNDMIVWLKEEYYF